LSNSPKIDSDLGISVYTTSFSGCGGKIRESTDDFEVSEIFSESALSKINQDNGYAVYKLKKHDIDTNHALSKIFQKHGLRLKAFGLKDAKGITEQFVCSHRQLTETSKISEKKISLEPIGFVKKPFTKKDMIGNNFKIKITDNEKDFSNFNEENKILNFYGYQRFGSKRPVTHLIGKSLIQNDYDGAIDELLCTTSEYDSKENTELREKLSDRNNLKFFFDEIPPQMDLEKTVVGELIRHKDSKKAFHALPLSIRRFFVQAYQSFIFNKTLSLAFSDGEDLFLPHEGDVCFDASHSLGKFCNDPLQRLAIPFVGYAYYKKTRFHYQISKVLESEEIEAKNFFLKDMQELSSEGGFRNASIKCDDFTISDNVVSFSLSRGSFATILLREIIKPQNPILAGF